jgi:AcrR family transcriptional regulator
VSRAVPIGGIAVERELRRHQILDAARVLFASRGYHDTAVSDIIDAADIARGTFYLHFDSKRAIFDELLDEFLVAVRRCVRRIEVGRGSAPPYAQLRGSVSRVLALLLDRHEMTAIVLGHTVGVDAAADAKLDAFYDELAGALERALQAGRTLGLSSADPPLGARLLLGGIREVVAYLLKHPAEAAAREQVVDEILRVGLCGVMSGPPVDLQHESLTVPRARAAWD